MTWLVRLVDSWFGGSENEGRNFCEKMHKELKFALSGPDERKEENEDEDEERRGSKGRRGRRCFGDLSAGQQLMVQSEVVENLMLKCKNHSLAHVKKGRLSRERRTALEWIFQICHSEKFEITTRQLACLIFDKAYQNVKPFSEDLDCFALSCLEVAAKFEEMEIDIPVTSDLVQHFGSLYVSERVDQVRTFELQILDALSWEVGLATPAHVLEVVISQDLVFHKADTCERQLLEHETMVEVVEKTYMFLALATFNKKMQAFKPHIIAFACITAARYSISVSPAWSPVLGVLFELHESDDSELDDCFEYLRPTAEELRRSRLDL